MVAQSTASIINESVPSSDNLDLSLLQRIEADLIAILVGQGSVPLIEIAVPCLCVIAKALGKYSSIASIMSKCIGFINKIRDLDQLPAGAFMSFVKSMLIVSLIVRNADLDALQEELGESSRESMFGKVREDFHALISTRNR